MKTPRPIRLTCGCKHDSVRWLHICEPCKTEHDEIKARWAAERKQSTQEKGNDNSARS